LTEHNVYINIKPRNKYVLQLDHAAVYCAHEGMTRMLFIFAVL